MIFLLQALTFFVATCTPTVFLAMEPLPQNTRATSSAVGFPSQGGLRSRKNHHHHKKDAAWLDAQHPDAQELIPIANDEGLKQSITSQKSFSRYLFRVINKEDAAELRAVIAQHPAMNVNAYIGNATPLLQAAYLGDSECLEVLIQAGADVHKKTADGTKSPLYYATFLNNTACLEALIKAGANVHGSYGKDGETALIAAARKGNLAALQILIAAGANVHQPSQAGYTALFWAAMNDYPRCVEELIKAGANVNQESCYGHRALDIAYKNPKSECIKILKEAGAEQKTICSVS